MKHITLCAMVCALVFGAVVYGAEHPETKTVKHQSGRTFEMVRFPANIGEARNFRGLTVHDAEVATDIFTNTPEQRAREAIDTRAFLERGPNARLIRGALFTEIAPGALFASKWTFDQERMRTAFNELTVEERVGNPTIVNMQQIAELIAEQVQPLVEAPLRDENVRQAQEISRLEGEKTGLQAQLTTAKADAIKELSFWKRHPRIGMTLTWIAGIAMGGTLVHFKDPILNFFGKK